MDNKDLRKLPGASLEDIAKYVTLKGSEIFDEVLTPIQQEFIAWNNLKYERIKGLISEKEFIELLESIKQNLRRIIVPNNKELSEIINCIAYLLDKMKHSDNISPNVYKFFLRDIFQKDFYGSKMVSRRVSFLGIIIMFNGIRYDAYREIDLFNLKKKIFLFSSSPESPHNKDTQFLKYYIERKRFDLEKELKEILKKLYDRSSRNLNKLINLCDTDGNSPLHYCMATGDVNLCDLLLRNKAYKNTINKKLKSPVKIALENYNIRGVELMIKYNTTIVTNDRIEYRNIFSKINK